MKKFTIEGFKKRGIKIYKELPKGWVINTLATTNPDGYVWISNNKSLFDRTRKHGLLKIGGVK